MWRIPTTRPLHQFVLCLLMILVLMFARHKKPLRVPVFVETSQPHDFLKLTPLAAPIWPVWSRQVFAKLRTTDQRTTHWPMRQIHPISNQISKSINPCWPCLRRHCVYRGAKLHDHLVRLSLKPSKTTFKRNTYTHTLSPFSSFVHKHPTTHTKTLTSSITI